MEVDCNLNLGDTQHIEFLIDADCPPLFYAPDAAREDCAKLDKEGK